MMVPYFEKIKKSRLLLEKLNCSDILEHIVEFKSFVETESQNIKNEI